MRELLRKNWLYADQQLPPAITRDVNDVSICDLHDDFYYYKELKMLSFV